MAGWYIGTQWPSGMHLLSCQNLAWECRRGHISSHIGIKFNECKYWLDSILHNHKLFFLVYFLLPYTTRRKSFESISCQFLRRQMPENRTRYLLQDHHKTDNTTYNSHKIEIDSSKTTIQPSLQRPNWPTSYDLNITSIIIKIPGSFDIFLK